MCLPTGENLGGLQESSESIFSLFRGPQLNPRKNIEICCFYTDVNYFPGFSYETADRPPVVVCMLTATSS